MQNRTFAAPHSLSLPLSVYLPFLPLSFFFLYFALPLLWRFFFLCCCFSCVGVAVSAKHSIVQHARNRCVCVCGTAKGPKGPEKKKRIKKFIATIMSPSKDYGVSKNDDAERSDCRLIRCQVQEARNQEIEVSHVQPRRVVSPRFDPGSADSPSRSNIGGVPSISKSCDKKQ